MILKTPFFCAAICLLIILLASCESQEDSNAQSEAPTVLTSQLDTMPLDTAIRYTAGWQNAIAGDTSLFGGQEIFAFTIPRSDFENLLEATKNTSYDFRAYLGYKAIPDTLKGENYFELMLVAVDNNGDDVINANNFIYDFTAPCPDQCDDNSPLCGGCK